MAGRLRSGNQRKTLFRRATLVLILLGIAVAALIFGDTVPNRLQMVSADTEEDPVPLSAVEKKACVVTIPAFGEIAGANNVSIHVPETRSGPLTIAWMVPEGSLVKAGELLVRFDKTDLELILEKQKNALASINKRIEIAEKAKATSERGLKIDTTSAELDYQYAKDLLPEDKSIFSKWEIMEAEMDTKLEEERLGFLKQKQQLQAQISESDLRLALIDRDQAKAEMDIARKTMEALELTAPVPGVVIYHKRRNVKPEIGDQCWPRQVLLEVMELEKLQARLYVLERDAGGLKAGMEADIQLDSFPDRTFKGRIESVTPLAQSLERNSPLLYFTCDASIAMTPEDLEAVRPGMLLEAGIIRQKFNSCMIVPESAIVTKEDEDLVYTQQNGKFTPRAVETAPGPHGQMLILKGVGEGEIIALRNPFETRKLSLPDFSKASRTENRNRPPSRGMSRMRRSR
jgi:multidrug efflux pump subunit AcrA (membrane-fusion protein)